MGTRAAILLDLLIMGGYDDTRLDAALVELITDIKLVCEEWGIEYLKIAADADDNIDQR